MLETHLRQASSALLQAAIRIAPADTRDWGRAMAAELTHVEGDWGAAMWAVGGAGVLARQAILALVIPGRHGQGIVPDDGLLAKNRTLRNATIAVAGACMLAALVFFASPPFRQAFQVALAPWQALIRLASASVGRRPIAQPDFADLARRAEQRHDAEGIAFCAIRIQGSPAESARLAEEAVRLDHDLIWIYAVVALRHPGIPQSAEWVEKLNQRDPQNAVFHLISAKLIEQGSVHQGGGPPTAPEQQRAWRAAMAAAFDSPEFDDSLDRVAQLTHQVVTRYEFYDPFEVLDRDQVDLPAYTLDESERYAESILAVGEQMESQGDRTGGREQYWSVARFGQMIDGNAHTDFERRMGTGLQSLAYRRLQASFQSAGNASEAVTFGYLAAKFGAASGRHPAVSGESAFDLKTAGRNAAVVEMSGLMILIFGGLAVVAFVVLVAGGRLGGGFVAQRVKPVAIIVGLSSAVGMLFSSVTLYLTYRPYWYIFQSAIQSGGAPPTADLRYLLHGPTTPGFSSHVVRTLLDAFIYSGSPSFLFYVWTGVTLLGIGGLILIVLRRMRGGPHAHAP